MNRAVAKTRNMKNQTMSDIRGTASTVSASMAPTLKAAQNIDGFFRARKTTLATFSTPPVSDKAKTTSSVPSAHRTPNHAKAHTPQPAKTSAIRVHSTVQHSQKLTVHRTPSTANHHKAHSAQASQTLMRTAVKRPGPSLRKQLGTVGSLQHGVPSLIVPKKSVLSLDEQRLIRAKTVGRSPFIAHHSTPKPGVVPTVAPVPVAPQPVRPTEETPVAPPAHKNQKPTDIFEHALANASHYVDIHAHHRAYRKKVKTHVASMLAGSMVLIAIASFVAYQNSPALQFRVAAIRAGVSAHMPNYAAIGYTYNGVQAHDGKLVIGLKHGQSAYTVTQQPTNLSNDDMIQTVGATDASGVPDYTSIPAGATTVYRFGNNTATWVQDGKWYTVTGTGALGDAQLQKLVKNI